MNNKPASQPQIHYSWFEDIIPASVILSMSWLDRCAQFTISHIFKISLSLQSNALRDHKDALSELWDDAFSGLLLQLSTNELLLHVRHPPRGRRDRWQNIEQHRIYKVLRSFM